MTDSDPIPQDSEHTTARLARALEAIPGCPGAMIKRARDGYYHDLSPLATPEIQLVADLREAAARPQTPRNSRPLLREMAQRVINGEFDASKQESDEWAASPEGREAMAALTGQPGVPGSDDGNAVKACADLVARAGGRSFECGHLHDGVPAEEAGWHATAVFRGVKIIAQDKASPVEACNELAARVLSGGQCQHCGKLVTLSPFGAAARDVTLMNGKTWTAAEQAKAGLCYWQRDGARWERGCTG